MAIMLFRPSTFIFTPPCLYRDFIYIVNQTFAAIKIEENSRTCCIGMDCGMSLGKMIAK